MPDGWDPQFERDPDAAYSAGEWLAFAIRPEADGDRRAAAAFWESALGADQAALIARPGFVKGFAEGALEVYRKFKEEPWKYRPAPVLYRPAHPTRPDFKDRSSHPEVFLDPNMYDDYFMVCSGRKPVVAYFPYYFRTLEEVVADLASSIVAAQVGNSSGYPDEFTAAPVEFVVWRHRLVGAVVRQVEVVDEDDELEDMFFQVITVGSSDDTEAVERRERDALHLLVGLPGWPSYEQWVADGADKIILRPAAEALAETLALTTIGIDPPGPSELVQALVDAHKEDQEVQTPPIVYIHVDKWDRRPDVD